MQDLELSWIKKTKTEKMGRLGFEPRTNRLKAECSTAELATHTSFGAASNLQARLLSIARKNLE